MDKEYILRLLHAQVKTGGHIVGAAVGSGMTAKLAAMGGADILLALSAGKYRIMGRSSLSSYFCYGNNNELVMEMGKHEIFPIVRDVPLFFGLMASDPEIRTYDYLQRIKASGFSGIVNSPTLALVDGQFREALEEDGVSYDREVAAIRMANHLGLATMAFVTNTNETEQMLDARADIICAHLGLTKGGLLGAKRSITMGEARQTCGRIFALCQAKNPQTLRMVYAGPANSLSDMKYLYHNTSCQGYVGGSTFDRIPMEKSVFDTVRSFKRYDDPGDNDPLNQLIDHKWAPTNIVARMREYIEDHYMEEVQLNDIALVSHMSASYLGARFKREMKTNFTEYLLRFRLNKAKELLAGSDVQCKAVAAKVGYTDYIQFSKMFKKYLGLSPREYQRRQSEQAGGRHDG